MDRLITMYHLLVVAGSSLVFDGKPLAIFFGYDQLATTKVSGRDTCPHDRLGLIIGTRGY